GPVRERLDKIAFGPFVAAPLRGATEGFNTTDGHRTTTPGWEMRGEFAGVVLLARARGVSQADVERLVPFARQAGEALSRQRDVELLRETSESHAIETERLWRMVNAAGDALPRRHARDGLGPEERHGHPAHQRAARARRAAPPDRGGRGPDRARPPRPRAAERTEPDHRDRQRQPDRVDERGGPAALR